MTKLLTISISLLIGLALGVGGSLYLNPPSTSSLTIDAARAITNALNHSERRAYEARQTRFQQQAKTAQANLEASKLHTASIQAQHDRQVGLLENTIQQATESIDEANLDRDQLLTDLIMSIDIPELDDFARQEVRQRLSRNISYVTGNYEVEISELKRIVKVKDKQIQLKNALISAQELDINAWVVRFNTEQDLRLNAERRVDQLDNSGFKFGIGALAGAVKPLGGPTAPGYGVGITVSYTF